MGATVEIGIDLGTTNSAIAEQRGSSATLLPAADGSVLLPSAVRVHPDGRTEVGRAAHAAMHEHPDEVAVEFKRLMGTGEKRTIGDRSYSPEQLSAMVLTKLLGRVRPELTPVRAAVITIPAMFQLPQCDATRRAAELAGIVHAPLLQEPIAAAIAHSGSGTGREGYWLVYDLGGGTFDVSLVRAKGGRLQILDHGGDNHLGGRDFDRAIARHVADTIRSGKQHGELLRTDPRFHGAFAKIKAAAERARIELSEREQVEVRIEKLIESGPGAGIPVALTIDRGLLESLITPLIKRTTRLCNDLLARNRVTAAELKGLVMVGGPTLTPCLPPMISKDVGIEAKHFVDPMTIVAQGAALFASTQKVPAALRAESTKPGGVEVQLEFEAMTTNPEPLVVGKLDPARFAKGKAELRATDGSWASGPLPIGPKGSFAADVKLKKDAMNVLSLRLWDPSGAEVPCSPSEIKILHGFSVANPPLSRSVGVMLADNTVAWFLRKGAVLPARGRRTHTTTVPLKRGDSGEAIHVPLIQGESDRGDRNKVVGVLRIQAERIGRDLPAGTEVEIEIQVDESSRTTGRAFVPVLDQHFDDVVLFSMETKEAADVKKGLAAQKDRLAQLSKLADDLDGDGSTTADARVKEVEALIEEGDRDSVDLADQLVRMMTEKIDAAEDVSRKKKITDFHAQLLKEAEGVLPKYGNDAEKRELKALAEEFKEAIKNDDLELATAKNRELDQLIGSVLYRTPGYWIALYDSLVARLKQLGLLGGAMGIVQRGEAAIKRNDIKEVSVCAMELHKLLPSAQRQEIQMPGVTSQVK